MNLKRIDYSTRRYFVDDFYTRQINNLEARARVLDLGGNKIAKRGVFSLEHYPLHVVYANLVTTKHPDVQADAARLPFKPTSFDAVICAELLEHVPDPRLVLAEVHRVLQPGGILLVTVPFLYHIHADPYDYGRYTDYYWFKNLSAVGFTQIEIEKQGLFWSVLVDMLRNFLYRRRYPIGIRSLTRRIVVWARRRALRWEASKDMHPILLSYTTGFGIKAIRL